MSSLMSSSVPLRARDLKGKMEPSAVRHERGQPNDRSSNGSASKSFTSSEKGGSDSVRNQEKPSKGQC